MSEKVLCQYCDSDNVELKNSHNLCKNSYICNDCHEVFATYNVSYKRKIGRQPGFSPVKIRNGEAMRELWSIVSTVDLTNRLYYEKDEEFGWG